MKNNTYISIMKICRKCDSELSLDFFWRRKKTPDGYSIYCKDCEKKIIKNHDRVVKNNFRTMRQVDKWGLTFKDDIRVKKSTTYKDKWILDDIFTTIQEEYGVTHEMLANSFRFVEVCIPRHHFFWFVDYYKSSFIFKKRPFSPNNLYVANLFGRHHATFRCAVNKINDMLDTDKNFKCMHEKIFDSINEKLNKYVKEL